MRRGRSIAASEGDIEAQSRDERRLEGAAGGIDVLDVGGQLGPGSEAKPMPRLYAFLVVEVEHRIAAVLQSVRDVEGEGADAETVVILPKPRST